MLDLVRQHSCQLLRRLGGREQPAVDDNESTGRRECI
jgi:hypothetical protein